MMTTLKKTLLHKVHRSLKAKMIDFSRWKLPAWYASMLEEHKAVRLRICDNT